MSQLPVTETVQCKSAPLSLLENGSPKSNESNNVILFLIIPFFLLLYPDPSFFELLSSLPLLFPTCPSWIQSPPLAQGEVPMHFLATTQGFSLLLFNTQTQALNAETTQTSRKQFLLHVSSGLHPRLCNPNTPGNLHTVSSQSFTGFMRLHSYQGPSVFPRSTYIPFLGFLLSSLLWADCFRIPPQIKQHGIAVSLVSPDKEGRKEINFYTISPRKSDTMFQEKTMSRKSGVWSPP